MILGFCNALQLKCRTAFDQRPWPSMPPQIFHLSAQGGLEIPRRSKTALRQVCHSMGTEIMSSATSKRWLDRAARTPLHLGKRWAELLACRAQAKEHRKRKEALMPK